MADPRSLVLPAAVVGDLKTIRALVRDTAVDAGFDEVGVDDLVQAVDETATNVLVHGYAGRPGRLVVTIESGPSALTVRIEDDAPVFDPRDWERPDAAADWRHRRPGGFGIPLTRGCVDEIYHRPRDHDRGNVLTLVKRGPGRDRDSA